MNFDKTKTTTLALVLMLTFSATILALPAVSAHDPPWEIPVHTYSVVTPNPLGVNQQMLIVFWPDWYPPTAVGAYGDRYTWTITITTPSGSEDNIGPIESDPLGGGYASYTPTQVGTYTVVCTLADRLITGLPEPPTAARNTEYINDTMLGSSTTPISVTVQEDPIQPYPETPYPNEEFYTRPFNTVNRNWYQMAANWLDGAAQTVGPTTNFAYGEGPESAHIMWATPMWAGGIMDERFGDTGYETGHYEGIGFQPPIILNGKIYYNIRSIPREGYQVLDLYTGEKLWFKNSTGPVTGAGGGFDYTGYLPYGLLSFGQIYDYSSPNQHGGFPYLWSTSGPDGTWQMFDAETGNYICSIENIPSWVSTRRLTYGKEGSILCYNLDTRNNLLRCWNTSRAIWYEDEFYSNTYWMWRPTLNETFNGENGVSLNVSIPDVTGSSLAIREGEFIIGGSGGQNDAEAVVQGNLWALSLEQGHEGELLWEVTFTPPRASAPASLSYRGRYPVSGPTVVPEYGVFLFEEPVTLKRWGYDLGTGQQLWETDPEPSMNYYGLYDSIYDGKLYSYGYGGTLICYDILTGEELWRYEASNVGFESPYGNYPIYVAAICDGKIYLVSGEHSLTQPLWRGPNLRCIDADTGEEVWKITYMGAGDGGAHLTATTTVIADGYVVGLNYYDARIYCFGKGPSKTTVDANPKVSDWGSSVLFEGMVTDIAPGTTELETASRFPNGVPAIADEYQEDWMEYVYMQQPCPAMVEGVKVKLETLDPNNNFYEIGTTTTDASGFYSLDWEPPVPGKYTIYATFEGSKSYYRSYSETAIVVTESPSPGQPFEPELTEPTTTEAPLITTEIAIIAVVVVAIIIGIIAFWALRKRK